MAKGRPITEENLDKFVETYGETLSWKEAYLSMDDAVKDSKDPSHAGYSLVKKNQTLRYKLDWLYADMRKEQLLPPDAPKSDLITRQDQRVIDYYLTHLPYSIPKALEVCGVEYKCPNSYFFVHPARKAYKDRKQRAILENANMTAESILINLAQVGFAPIGDESVPLNMKLKALEMAQKQLGLLEKKVDVKTDSEVIKVEVIDQPKDIQ